MPDLASLQATAARLRANVAAARQRFTGSDAALAAANAQLAAAQSSGGDTAALTAQRDALAKQRAAALQQQNDALDRFRATIGPIVEVIGTVNPFAGLDPLVPLVLLPVRLETRFNPAKPSELLVRIIPDDVHGDSHEPELTALEIEAGKRYWDATWRGGTADPGATAAEQAAWKELVARAGVGRAAWIVRVMTPSNASARPAQATAAAAPLPVAPVFPQPASKGDAWTRAPWTTALPDRWVVMAYRDGARVGTGWGNTVPDHVHMGPDPSVAAPPDGTRIDPGLAWVVDFAAAEAVGLGVRVTVPPVGGLDRVVAFGVRMSLDPTASAARLAGLLDAHHYTRGLSFVPQGTPTNNTPSDRAGWTSRPTAASSFAVERRAPATDPAGNGSLLAGALGLDPALFAAVAHANEREQTGARSMATLLWGPTMGYYLEQMMQYNGPSADQIAVVRSHFIDYVRGRGPLAALRVGNQPYGVLPATSLQRWKGFDEDATTANIAPVLRAAQPFWSVGAQSVPRLGGTGDLDVDFVHALTLDARSALLQVRTVQSPTFCRATYLLNPPGRDPNLPDPCIASMELADATWAAFDLRGGLLGRAWHPRVADVTYAGDAAMLRLPFVDGAPGPKAYLDTLRTAPLSQISTDASHAATATSVLGTLARHAVLLAYGAAADDLGRRSTTGSGGVVIGTVHPVAEMFGAPAGVAALSNRFSSATSDAPTKALFSPIAGVTGTATAADFLRQNVRDFRTTHGGIIVINQTLIDIDNALADLAGRDVADLENLLAETLDAVSHRLDAWITSLATRRLHAVRAQRPHGVYLGGFGWVENLQRRAAEPPATPPAGETGPLIADTDGGGYVHAPSLAHAATAAVLRSANLSHAHTASASDAALAIDLSSRRVCLALELLDGVRAGQPLGALLGYRLERALHDAHPSLELDRYIAPLRRLAPLVAGGVTPPKPGESLESIAARNVVDGLALSRLDSAQVRAKVAADVGAPPATNDELNAVMAEVAAVTDAVDGLSDVLLSDGVYHVIQGNPMRAGMTVDAINRGSVAPEPEIVRTPRSGTAIAHRLMVLLPAADGGPAPGWRRAGPRAAAEPRLDAWAGRLLGDPARVRMIARFTAAAGVHDADVSLADLVGGADPLSALDVVYDANASDGAISTLEQRLTNRLALTPPAGAPAAFTSVRLVRGRNAAWPSSALAFEEFVTLAAALRTVVVGGRHVTGVELGRPEDDPQPALDAADLRARSGVAAVALQSAAAALNALLKPQPTADVLALVRASDALAAFGMLPPGRGDASRDRATALTQASALAAVAGDRVAAVAKLQAAPRPANDPKGSYDLAILAAVFGGEFRTLPLCRPANGSLLAAAFAASDALQGGDPLAAGTWLRRTAAVRPAALRMDDALLFAQALGTGAQTDLRVAQIPCQAGALWAGLPQAPPAAPTTTFVAHAAAPLDPHAGVAGLFLDEWSEVVPSPMQTTAISFEASTPRARAPQSILLAVSPDPKTPWDLDTFEAVLNETFELARERMVDLDTLPWAGHFLPAIYIADSAFNSTPGIHWKDIVANANLKFQAALARSPS